MAGGNNSSGTGGGSGGAASATGSAGTAGGGGGGGGTLAAGGAGGAGNEWGTLGSGGGGGAGSMTGTYSGGAGGLYGAGGGGAAYQPGGPGGSGAQGVIVITYWSTSASGGNVGIGIANPSYLLDVGGQARFTSGYTTSDRRLKTNIANMTYGISDVMRLRPVTFNWIKPVKGEEGRRVGFIAQEIEKVLPEVVSTANDPSKTKAVEYGNIIPLAIKAIQELKSDNDNLRTEFEIYKRAHH